MPRFIESQILMTLDGLDLDLPTPVTELVPEIAAVGYINTDLRWVRLGDIFWL